MDIHIHNQNNKSTLHVASGECFVYRLEINVDEQGEATNACISRFADTKISEIALAKLGIDSNFKGRTGDNPLHPVCIKCLSRLCTELEKRNNGMPSEVYE